MVNSIDDISTLYSSKQNNYFDLTRAEILPFIPKESKKILDVGCSSGGFGAHLKQERPDIEVWGIEPSQDAAAKASEKLDRVICGTFQGDLAELKDQKFDCIVFNDVLEHLVDPELALVHSKQYLSENGSVVASIPNILYFHQMLEIITEQDWRYRDSGILDNTHLRFFTKKSILRMFENTGFELVLIAGISSNATKFYRFVNLLTLNFIKDWRYLQFAIVAKPKG